MKKHLRVIVMFLLVEAAGYAAWRAYDAWRQGRVVLTSEGPPMLVKVFDESGEVPIVGPIGLVSDTTLTLPDGDYRLRVDGPGRLGQTYRLAVHRGETIAHRLGLEPITDDGQPIAKDPAFDEKRLQVLQRPAPPAVATPDGFDPVFKPIRPIQSAELDGDGTADLLALGQGLVQGLLPLAAFTGGGRPLWKTTVTVRSQSPTMRPDPSVWPWLFDLDGDGRAEVAVPDTGPVVPGGRYRGLRLIDGATGQDRWVHPMAPETKADDGLTQLAPAPDLDGDGVRDLVAVSLFRGRQTGPIEPWGEFAEGLVLVDALSGRDGHPLWTWKHGTPPGPDVLTWPVRWWGRGPDGWPLLAIPLGGKAAPERRQHRVPDPVPRPIVSVLEASTGRERHTILGLHRPEAIDLDGDGLDDLWGEVDGRRQAVRGEEPEAWLALGRFEPAAEAQPASGPTFVMDAHGNGRDAPSSDFGRFHPVADLDGDGVGDVLIARVFPPNESLHAMTGSRTAVARSGRDGHLLWKAVLDRPGFWNEPDGDRGVSFALSTFPLPAGDIDGDGTPDVLATRNVWPGGEGPFRPPATLPMQVLSGRTGRRLWSAGALPPDSAPHGRARINPAMGPIALRIEANAASDVLVPYSTPYVWPGSPQFPGFGVGHRRMARLSGRDGRVVWDIALSEGSGPTAGSSWMIPSLNIPMLHTGDLDGDGSLDAVIVHSPAPGGHLSIGDASTDIALQAVSLKDGRPLWSRGFPLPSTGRHQLLLAVGDIDGDRRAEVLVAHADARDGRGHAALAELSALDGPDARILWSWRGDTKYPMDFYDLIPAHVDGGRRQAPCVALGYPSGRHRLVQLDAHGGETWDRELPSRDVAAIEAADLDGDGNDEIWLFTTTGPQLLGPDGRPAGSGRPVRAPDGLWYRASASKQHGALLVPPALGLSDRGATFGPRLLDPGGASRPPLWMVGSPDSTVIRSALPILPDGRYAPPRGTPARPRSDPDDPRWARPWPWIEPIRRTIGPRGWVAVIGLAMVNVVVPLGIIRLAARRQPWSLRLLMTLPIGAAIPLAAFQARESLLPAQIGPVHATSRLLFVLGTLAGLPLVIYIGAAASSLFRGGWWRRLGLLGLTMVASAVVRAAWIAWDLPRMPDIEHYDTADAWLVLLPGMYAAGVVLMIAWPFRPIFRRIRRALT